MLDFSTPMFLGHRGLPSKYRENTLASFKAAIDSKADGIELDIHLTKDNKLAVIHDHSTKRTTGIDKVVEELTMDELKAIDKEIPTLEEVFELFKDKIIYDIELKEKPFVFSKLPNIALEVIKRYKLEDNVMISSFNPFPLRAFKKVCKNIPTAIIYDAVPSVPRIMQHGEGKIICSPNFLKPGINVARQQLKVSKKPISVWCVDTKKEAEEFIALGAKVIISNKVDEIRL